MSCLKRSVLYSRPIFRPSPLPTRNSVRSTIEAPRSISSGVNLRHPAGTWTIQRLNEIGRIDHHGLEQRVAASVTDHVQLVHQDFEGHVLVDERLHNDIAHLIQKLPERRPGRNVGAQDERVDEAADQVFGLLLGAARDWRAYPQVRLTGKAIEQDLEHREIDHIGRAARGLAERLDCRNEWRRHEYPLDGAIGAAHRWTGIVRRHVQNGRQAPIFSFQ